MKLINPAFSNMGEIPARYTCDGENINPPLKISDVPEGAASLALIMEDPDVPRTIRQNGMWDHWLVWNIPGETKEIKEGQALSGVQGNNTGGKAGYAGPCPPDREHRYFFKLYALDIMLDLPQDISKSDLQKAMEGHVLDYAELVGLYGANRKR